MEGNTQFHQELASIHSTFIRSQEDHLGIPEKALREWVASGQLKTTKAGNRRYIYYPNLLQFLADGTPEVPIMGRGSRGGRR